MTTLQFCKDTDTFRIVNDTRIADITRDLFYSRLHDQDVIEAAMHAIECTPDAVTVSSQTNARGVTSRRGERLGVHQ
jgi:hypothetical protein